MYSCSTYVDVLMFCQSQRLLTVFCQKPLWFTNRIDCAADILGVGGMMGDGIRCFFTHIDAGCIACKVRCEWWWLWLVYTHTLTTQAMTIRWRQKETYRVGDLSDIGFVMNEGRKSNGCIGRVDGDLWVLVCLLCGDDDCRWPNSHYPRGIQW